MERKQYCDYLRVFATFAVVVLHVSATNWYITDVNGMEWQAFNFYDSIVRWGGSYLCYDKRQPFSREGCLIKEDIF